MCCVTVQYCMCACVRVCVHLCVCAHVCTYVCIRICVCACACRQVRTYVCAHVMRKATQRLQDYPTQGTLLRHTSTYIQCVPTNILYVHTFSSRSDFVMRISSENTISLSLLSPRPSLSATLNMNSAPSSPTENNCWSSYDKANYIHMVRRANSHVTK